VARLTRENEALKAQVRRGNDRSRSPRRPTSSSQATMDQTCKALAQVRLWQRDAVVEEMKATIVQQEQQLVNRDNTIKELRQGSGPIGEVLQHIYERQLEKIEHNTGTFSARGTHQLVRPSDATCARVYRETLLGCQRHRRGATSRRHAYSASLPACVTIVGHDHDMRLPKRRASEKIFCPI